MIAAAESNGLLFTFLENYRKYAKTPKGSQSVTPNYTRLSMVDLPRRTAGRKGGKAPKKKSIARRKVTPSEQRQPLLVDDVDVPSTTANCSSNTVSGSSFDSIESKSKSSPSLTVITTSSGNWNWNWD